MALGFRTGSTLWSIRRKDCTGEGLRERFTFRWSAARHEGPDTGPVQIPGAPQRHIHFCQTDKASVWRQSIFNSLSPLYRNRLAFLGSQANPSAIQARHDPGNF